MKKLIFTLIISLISLIGCGQHNPTQPIMDSGYYFGMIDDSLHNKYIFMTFLSNDDDNIVYIVPYIETDVKFMHNNFIKSIPTEDEEKIVDGNLLIEKLWTIPGFDNFSYYTFEKNIISFSLNIATRESNYIGVFEFNGILSDDGTIVAVISSTDSIFNKSTLVLTYKKLPK